VTEQLEVLVGVAQVVDAGALGGEVDDAQPLDLREGLLVLGVVVGHPELGAGVCGGL
jgi:hypothetical protein